MSNDAILYYILILLNYYYYYWIIFYSNIVNTIYVATGRLTVLPCLVLLTLEVPIYFGFMIFICSHRCKQLGTTRNTEQETDGPEESQTSAVAAKNPIFDN